MPAPTAPQQIPKRASVRQDSGPRMPVTPGSAALAGEAHVLEDQLAR